MKNWTHFTNRKRYERSADGSYSGVSWYERAFCGLQSNKKRQWLLDLVPEGQVATVLMVGNTKDEINVVFIYDDKNKKFFVNNKNNTNSTEYVDFFESQLKDKKVNYEKIPAELPTVAHTRAGRSTAVKSLEQAVALASDDSLGF